MRSLSAEQAETEIVAAMARNDWTSVAALTPILDAIQAKPPTPMLAAALWYADHALRVFPLQPGKKVPYPGTKGFKDATTEVDQLRAWWVRWPHSNIGLATGHGVDVIDIDGLLGVQSWAKTNDLPPIIGTVSTPREGGSHLYVVASGKGNRAAMFPGIDYRGLGGYVVAPPSVNDDGVRYYWRRPLLTDGIPGRRLVCAVCGQVMIFIEAGQTTHPGCG